MTGTALRPWTLDSAPGYAENREAMLAKLAEICAEHGQGHRRRRREVYRPGTTPGAS